MQAANKRVRVNFPDLWSRKINLTRLFLTRLFFFRNFHHLMSIPFRT